MNAAVLIAPAPPSRFFARSAWVMLALVLLSFPLTYYGPMLSGAKVFRPLRHIHGLFFFAWMILYTWQAQLVAGRKLARHCEIGLFGFMLAGGLTIMGVVMALAAGHERALAGTPRPYEFTWYNFVDIANFTGFILATVATAMRNSVWHRRFAYIAAVNLVAPAFSRWTLLVPLPQPWLYIFPSLAGDLFLAALAWHDRRTLGRVHPATWTGIAIMVPVHVVSYWIGLSVAWNGLAMRLFEQA